MSWGEGHEEGNIRRDLDEISSEVRNIGYRQIINSPIPKTHTDGDIGGGVLFIFLILAFPGVIIAYNMGAGDGSGIFSIIVNLCMGIYGLTWALFLWSLKNPFTMLCIAFPMIMFAGCILMVCFYFIKDWLENVILSFRRPRNKKTISK